MIAVVNQDTRQEISYHETTAEALIAIRNYEHQDKVEGTYDPNRYDWDFVEPE